MRKLLTLAALTGFVLILAPAPVQAETLLDLPYASVEGADPLDLSLDIHAPEGAKNAPVLIMVHGGGWTRGNKTSAVGDSQVQFFNDAGVIYVSINYRLAPENAFPDFMRDAAAAIAFVHREIAQYGGDPDRIFLMGHSAGAHIAALVSVDGRYLAEQGLTPAVIKGTVLLDGAAYDIPSLAWFGGRRLPPLYRPAFGDMAAVWRKASPTLQVDAGTPTPPMLLFYVNRKGSPEASAALAMALNQAGHPAETVDAFDRSHRTLNRSLGKQGDPYAPMFITFMKRQ